MPVDDKEIDELQQAVDNKLKEREEEQQQEREKAPEDLTDEELEERAQKKAKIAQLLDRGVVNDRLDVENLLGDDYDPSLHYEWIRENDTDIDRMRSLDFHVVTKEEPEEETHDAGDNRIRVGDVVLMACDREWYELIQEAREDKKEDKYGEPSKEYVTRAKAQGAPPIGRTAREAT